MRGVAFAPQLLRGDLQAFELSCLPVSVYLRSQATPDTDNMIHGGPGEGYRSHSVTLTSGGAGTEVSYAGGRPGLGD